MLWILENPDTISWPEAARYLPLLTETRRTSIRSMLRDPPKVRSVLAELLLRYALRREYGVTDLPRIETEEQGRPFFPDRPDIRFNLSHCRTAVVCALDADPLGVDVQEVCRLRRDGQCPSAPPVYRVLSEEERAWVEAGETAFEQDSRFTAVWTCKEAYGKALGCGILYAYRETAFLPAPGPWEQYGFVFQTIAAASGFLTVCAKQALPMETIAVSELIHTVSEELS